MERERERKTLKSQMDKDPPSVYNAEPICHAIMQMLLGKLKELEGGGHIHK
jgi:hypothetical protein